MTKLDNDLKLYKEIGNIFVNYRILKILEKKHESYRADSQKHKKILLKLAKRLNIGVLI